ncbi:MAG TPA: hypothetical protein VGF55_02685 [Gemmataceae bacterium]|jgi:hypothetical protein
MRREQIESALRTAPFKPFRLVLTTGDAHEVRHPEMVLMMPGTLIIGYPDLTEQGRDRFAVIDLSHVAQVDRATRPAPPGNGAADTAAE